MTPKEYVLMEQLSRKAEELEQLKEAIRVVEDTNRLKSNMDLPVEVRFVTRGKLEAIKDIHQQFELIKIRDDNL